ncbi:hypothetical protein Q7P37_005538 [Cladosporium fusiforme]
MHSSRQVSAGAVLAAMVANTAAQWVTPCGDQGCNSNCHDDPLESIGNGFPQCVIYNSADTIGAYENDEGTGYNVWFDSGEPDDNCRVIVRTPASQEVENCGNYLTSWTSAGCYQTTLQDSYNLQFCCGTGDCDAAMPSSSMAQARSLGMQGATASTQLVYKSENDNSTSGTKDLGNGASLRWAKRNSSPPAQLSKKKRDCDSYSEERKYTERGEQQRVSPTQSCTSNNGCDLEVSSEVTTGRSWSVGFSVTILEVISASTEMEFTESESYSLSTTFSQTSGSSGYVTFSPTLECTSGSVNDCDDDEDDSVFACTPRLLTVDGNSVPDGEFVFVYAQPGQGS